MSVRALLDDVAAEATAGLRIDLAAAHRQAVDQRSRARRRATAAMASAVAVAALVALVAVLLPGPAFWARPVTPAAPSGEQVGLPAHWYYAPPWTPPVTRHPMPAASMVLAAPLQTSWKGALYLGPVLVSADGRQYASLPWTGGSGNVALAADGRDVAWTTAAGGPGRAGVVHRIRLADGHEWSATLPARSEVSRLVWQGDRLIVALADGTGLALPAGSRSLTRLSALPTAAVDNVPLMDNSDFAAGDQLATPKQVRDPAGARTAELIQSLIAGKRAVSLQIGAGTRGIPITASDPVVAAWVLGWGDGGIVVRVQTSGANGTRMTSLRLYSPDGRDVSIVSRRLGALNYPIAVASEVAGSGVQVPGVRPTFAARDRSHLRYYAGQLYSQPHLRTAVLVVIVLLGVALMLMVVRRRRRLAPA
jgi:hypothetical protein